MIVLAAVVWPMAARCAEELPSESSNDQALRGAVLHAWSEAGDSVDAAVLVSEDVSGFELATAALASAPASDAEFERVSNDVLASDFASPRLRRQLVWQLDYLPTRLAERLRADARYNVAAEGTNAVLSGAVGLAQGNTRVLGRLGLVIARILGRGELTPRERKERSLRHQLSAESDARLEALDRRWLADELVSMEARVGDALLHRRFSEARFYADSIRSMDTARAAAALERVARAEGLWRRERGRALRVSLDERSEEIDREHARAIAVELPQQLAARSRRSTIAEDERMLYAIVEAAVRGEARESLRIAEKLVASPEEEQSSLVSRYAHGLTQDAQLAPTRAIEREEEYYAARLRYYKLAGRRDFGENAYITAYGAIGGIAGSLNTAVFFGLDTVLRSIATYFTAPFVAEDLIDAIARAERIERAERDPVLRMKIARLLLWGDEPARAHEMLGQVRSRDVKLLRKIVDLRNEAAEDAASSEWSTLRPTLDALTPEQIATRSPEARIAQLSLEALIARWPGTDGARRAQARLDEMPAPPFPDGWFAMSATRFAVDDELASIGTELPIRRGLLDGNLGNGEAEWIAVHIASREVACRLHDGRRIKLPFTPGLAAALLAARDAETRELMRIAAAKSQRRQILPLRLEGGVGAGGVDIAPQLKKVPFRDTDAHLYRR